MSNTNGDYISRTDALAAFEKVEHRYDPEWGNKRYAPDDVEEIINDVSAADVRPVVRGEWLDAYNEDKDVRVSRCSKCGHEKPRFCKPPFCEQCGADMRPEGVEA